MKRRSIFAKVAEIAADLDSMAIALDLIGRLDARKLSPGSIDLLLCTIREASEEIHFFARALQHIAAGPDGAP